MAMVLTLSASTVSRSSTASKWRLVSVTTHPPTVMAAMAVNPPVPCMRGQAGRCRGPGPTMVLRTPSVPPSSGTRKRFPALSLAKRSSWRHITPLGIPVVPPV